MSTRLRNVIGWVAIAAVLAGGLWVEIAPTLTAGRDSYGEVAACADERADEGATPMPRGVAAAYLAGCHIASVRLGAVATALGPLLIF